MNRPFTSTEVERVMASQANSYQTFREELTPILLKPFQKISEEGTLPSSIYEATITLIPKPDKSITQKEKIMGQYH